MTGESVMKAVEFVEQWEKDMSSTERDQLAREALSLPVLRYYAWEEPTEPGWSNEVLALFIDPEDNRRVFGFANIIDRDGYTGLGWEESEDLPERWEQGGGVLEDYDVAHDTGYFD